MSHVRYYGRGGNGAADMVNPVEFIGVENI
jgi:hypothetical protein